MSHPINNKLPVCALTSDNRPYLIDDGDWAVVGASPPEPLYRSLQLKVNNVVVFGFYPTWLSEDFSQAISRQGAFLRSDALAYRGPQLNVGDQFAFAVKAGFHNNYGTDSMEWGSGDPSQLDHEIFASCSGTVPVPDTPPVSDQPDFNWQAVQAIRDNIVRPELGAAKVDYFGWQTANPGEYDKATKFQNSLLKGVWVEPPKLTKAEGGDHDWTHFGKGYVNAWINFAFTMKIHP